MAHEHVARHVLGSSSRSPTRNPTGVCLRHPRDKHDPGKKNYPNISSTLQKTNHVNSSRFTARMIPANTPRNVH